MQFDALKYASGTVSLIDLAVVRRGCLCTPRGIDRLDLLFIRMRDAYIEDKSRGKCRVFTRTRPLFSFSIAFAHSQKEAKFVKSPISHDYS